MILHYNSESNFTKLSRSKSLLCAFCELATLPVSPLLPLHGESLDDLMNISQQAHGVSLKFFSVFCFCQWQLTNTFKRTHRNLKVISLLSKMTILQDSNLQWILSLESSLEITNLGHHPHSCSAKFDYFLLYTYFLFGKKLFSIQGKVENNKHTFSNKTSLPQ